MEKKDKHFEHGGRVQSFWSHLFDFGLLNQWERGVRKVQLELLRLVHSSTYITFFAISPIAFLKFDPADLPLKSFVKLPCGGVGVYTDIYFNDANTQVRLLLELTSMVRLFFLV